MVTSEPESSERLPRLIEEADSGTVLVSRWRIDQDKPSRSISNTSAYPVQIYIPSLQDISPRNALREKLMGVFINHHLPLDAIDSTRLAVKQRHWLLLVLDLPTLTPALEHAVLALCTARLGRYNDLQALIHESLSLYTSSLPELRRAFLDPVTRCNEQNIAACMALAMYEISECPGRMFEGYMSHYNGAMKLLRLRGADAHTSGLAHSLFQSLRRHSVSSASPKSPHVLALVSIKY
jgi:Fungal specific transcription factor domain